MYPIEYSARHYRKPARSSFLALTPFIVLEYLFTAFFTFEYVTRIYCSPQPQKYIFSFFGIIDLLATLPLYLAFFLPGARYLLIIRAFRIIRVFRIFKLFNFWLEGERLLTSLKESSKKIAVFFSLCRHPRRRHRYADVHDRGNSAQYTIQ